jgi:hypothetical protein
VICPPAFPTRALLLQPGLSLWFIHWKQVCSYLPKHRRAGCSLEAFAN